MKRIFPPPVVRNCTFGGLSGYSPSAKRSNTKTPLAYGVSEDGMIAARRQSGRLPSAAMKMEPPSSVSGRQLPPLMVAISLARRLERFFGEAARLSPCAAV